MGESLSKTDGKHSSDTWRASQGDYIARTKAKATDLSRLIQISVDAQFEHRESAPILDLIRGWEGGGNGFFIGNI